MQIKATGLRGDPKSGVALTADQNASLDFALQTGPVRWNELSIYQAKKLWPEEKAKQTDFYGLFYLPRISNAHGISEARR